MAFWLLTCALCLILAPGLGEAWGSSKKDKVLLRDVQVLTLQEGRMTAGRRSSPVRQLQCVGGSAGCRETPRSVQCYNRGFDGHDVNWECKADMDDDYRFGRITVSCEGYDYPEDPYILKGSCGLEYEIDWTGHGRQNQHSNSRDSGYFGSNHHYDDSYHNSHNSYSKPHRSRWTGSTWMVLAVVGVVIYAVYRCRRMNEDDDSSNGEDGDSHSRHGARPGDPPPSYSQSQDQYKPQQSQQTHSSHTSHSTAPPAGGQQGGGLFNGFFGGATVGGVLGYLLGSRNQNQYYGHRHGYHQPRYGGGWGTGGGWRTGGSSWGGGGSWGSGGGSSWGGSSSSSSSSRSRTTSGFGGTSRR